MFNDIFEPSLIWRMSAQQIITINSIVNKLKMDQDLTSEEDRFLGKAIMGEIEKNHKLNYNIMKYLRLPTLEELQEDAAAFVFTYLKSFDPNKGSFEWFVAMNVNSFIKNAIKERKSRPELISIFQDLEESMKGDKQLSLQDELRSHDLTPAEETEIKDIYDKIHDVLNNKHLPGKDPDLLRAIFEMTLKGKSLTDVGRATNTPVSNVKLHLWRDIIPEIEKVLQM